MSDNSNWTIVGPCACGGANYCRGCICSARERMVRNVAAGWWPGFNTAHQRDEIVSELRAIGIGPAPEKLGDAELALWVLAAWDIGRRRDDALSEEPA